MAGSGMPGGWLEAATKHAKAKLTGDIVKEQATAPSPYPHNPPVGTNQVFVSGYKALVAKKGETFREYHELNASEKALYEVISTICAEAPYEAEEREWALVGYQGLSEAVGISERQIRRILNKQNPFRHVVKKLEGKKSLLVRIGHPADLTNEDFARMMVKIWEEKFKSRPNAKQFGNLVGIAKEGPRDAAVDIFRTVLANWSGFMSGVHIAITHGQVEGDHFDPNPENFDKKYYQFPSITVIRRFWHVAVDYYEMRVQGHIADMECPYVYVPYDNAYKQILSLLIPVDTKKGT